MAKQPEKPALPSFEVVGPLPIADSITHESVGKGGIVQIDPEKIRIDWLIAEGYIVPMPAAGPVEG